MQLPDSWVESLFARLQVRYGAMWTNRWAGTDLTAVKADWSAELGGFANNPKAIERALTLLPVDRPPTVGQFLALCIGEPGDRHDELKRLPAPSIDPGIAQAIKRAFNPSKDPKAWARRLKARDFRGERLTIFQRDAWREALQVKPEAA